MADKDKKSDQQNTDPNTSASPQPSIDPVYQAGRTRGATDPGAPRAYANVTTDLRSVIGVSQDANVARRGFIGYPKTLYHPTLGARTVEDPNGEADLPGPQHNWWPTAGEADMHRTDLEAQEVILHARNWKNEVTLAMIDGTDLPTDKPEVGKGGVEEWPETGKPVRYSVQAEEVLKRGGVEPH